MDGELPRGVDVIDEDVSSGSSIQLKLDCAMVDRVGIGAFGRVVAAGGGCKDELGGTAVASVAGGMLLLLLLLDSPAVPTVAGTDDDWASGAGGDGVSTDGDPAATRIWSDCGARATGIPTEAG